MRWYRHRIAGPLAVWAERDRLAGDASSSLEYVLSEPPLKTGEIYEQIVSRTELTHSSALIELNDRINKGNLKAGKEGTDTSRRRGFQVQQASTTSDLGTGADTKTVFP
jgi:hypothetical protein